MLGDFWIDETAQVVAELKVRALLVEIGQAAIARHVGCQDGRKTSLYAFDRQDTLRKPRTTYLFRSPLRYRLPNRTRNEATSSYFDQRHEQRTAPGLVR